jgi:hypothetical protein
VPKGEAEDTHPKSSFGDPKRDGDEETVPKELDKEVAPKGELKAAPDEDPNGVLPNPFDLLPKKPEDISEDKSHVNLHFCRVHMLSN